jgi:hypothetical protein
LFLREKARKEEEMIWIVGGVFLGGFLIGVVFMSLLAMARDPETRPSLPDEAETGYLQRRLAPDAAGE